jgi:hypothetical protein
MAAAENVRLCGGENQIRLNHSTMESMQRSTLNTQRSTLN